MPSFSAIEDEVRNMLDVPDEDLDDAQKTAMDAYLNELATQEAEKADSFAQFVRLESARADALKEESARLAARAKSAGSRIAYLKGRYLQIMQEHGLQKIKGQLYTLSIRQIPAVRIDNESAIPAEYWTVKETRTVNKLALRDAIKAGKEVAGASLAESYSLQVR